MLDKPTAQRNIVLALKLAIFAALLFAATLLDRSAGALWLIPTTPAAASTSRRPRRCPFATSIGIALMLAGLVPDARIWRLALVSIGVMVTVIFGAQWIRDAVNEYRDLAE